MIKLDIGSGSRPAKGCLSLDANHRFHPDVVARVPPLPFATESVDAIRAHHVVEHIPDLIGFMTECWRVLKPSGGMEITAPYAFSCAAFQDPTHVRFIVPTTWLYFTHHFDYLQYAIKARFEILPGNDVYKAGAQGDEPEVRTILRKCQCDQCKKNLLKGGYL